MARIVYFRQKVCNFAAVFDTRLMLNPLRVLKYC